LFSTSAFSTIAPSHNLRNPVVVKTDVKQSITIAVLGHVHVKWLKRVPHATHLHERVMTTRITLASKKLQPITGNP